MNNPQYVPNSGRKPAPIEVAAQKALKARFDKLLIDHFMPAFQQVRTGHTVTDILATMMTQGIGRRTITNAILCRGEEQQDWNAKYRAFRTGKWDPVDLFKGVFQAALPLLPSEGPVVLGIDDTGLPKSGNNLENAGWIHNPLVPKYIHPAIQWGIPVLHACLLIPSEIVHRPMGIAVAFEPIPKEKTNKYGTSPKDKPAAEMAIEPAAPPVPKKRGRPTKEEAARKKAEQPTAAEEAGAEAKEAKLKSTELAVVVINRVRRWMDEADMADRMLLVVGDGAYTNKTVMLNLPHHTEYAGRTRPDTKLRAMGKVSKTGRIHYGPELPTPLEMAKGHMLEGIVDTFHYAGESRELRHLAMGPVFREHSTGLKPLRLMILEPIPKKRNKLNKKTYTERAYLLTTDMTLSPKVITAAYLDRWELEVLHRIYKTDLGIGTAQVQKNKIHAAMVAYFTLLRIAIRETQGHVRHAGYGPLPKWIAQRRAWFVRIHEEDGDPTPVFRPSPTDVKTLVIRALLPQAARYIRHVA